MLSPIKFNNNIQSSHVFSDWGLGSSVDGFVDDAARQINELKLDAHNNTITFTASQAQMAAYSPVEDKVYVNEHESLFAIFDGHGGGILNTTLFYLSFLTYISFISLS